MSIISKIALLGALSTVAVSPAIAGPFANIESNTSYFGDDRLNTTTDLHLGYEHDINDKVTVSIQAGPSFVNMPDADYEHEISGKVAISADVSESLNIYGEAYAITVQRDIEADFPIDLKVGARYSF